MVINERTDEPRHNPEAEAFVRAQFPELVKLVDDLVCFRRAPEEWHAEIVHASDIIQHTLARLYDRVFGPLAKTCIPDERDKLWINAAINNARGQQSRLARELETIIARLKEATNQRIDAVVQDSEHYLWEIIIEEVTDVCPSLQLGDHATAADEMQAARANNHWLAALAARICPIIRHTEACVSLAFHIANDCLETRATRRLRQMRKTWRAVFKETHMHLCIGPPHGRNVCFAPELEDMPVPGLEDEIHFPGFGEDPQLDQKSSVQLSSGLSN